MADADGNILAVYLDDKTLASLCPSVTELLSAAQVHLVYRAEETMLALAKAGAPWAKVVDVQTMLLSYPNATPGLLLGNHTAGKEFTLNDLAISIWSDWHSPSGVHQVHEQWHKHFSPFQLLQPKLS